MELEHLRTIDERFAVGYTKDYCRNIRDAKLFDKIDKDGDMILSLDEIIQRRKKEVNIKTIINAAGLVVGGTILAFGIKNKKMNIEDFGLGAGLLLGASFSQIFIGNEVEKTNIYEKELHKLNTES